MAVGALVVVGVAAGAPVSGPQPGDERVEEERARDREARENGDTAAQRDRRVSSRRAYRGLTRSEALELARARHPEFVLLPAWRAFVVPSGHEVVGYENDFVARVAAPNGSDSQTVVSNVPLRASSGDGRKRLVDLSLSDEGAAFRPVNPVAQTRLSKRLGDGLRLSESGVVARPVVEAEHDPVLAGDTLFYANALTDADVLVQPKLGGFAVHTQLRSEDSPERLALRLDAPSGATLHENRAAGRIEVRRGDAVIAAVSAPVAADADGRPVDVGWRLEGDRLVIDVAHRGRDYAYPLMVDPDVVETYEWERYGVDDGYGSISGWSYGSSGNFAGLSWAGNSTWLGNGLYIRNLQWGMGTSALYFYAGQAGWWSFGAPGFARLNRVEWNLFDQDYVDGTCTELGINGPGGWRPNNPSWSHCGVYYNQYAQSWGSGHTGDSATFKVQAVTTGHKPYFAAQVGVVYLYMSDLDRPAIGSGLPAGWVNWDADDRLDLWALDPSLGISEMRLSAPGWSGATIGPDVYSRCKRTYVCPRAHAAEGDSRVSVGDMDEGINTIEVVVTDPAGNERLASKTAALPGPGLRGHYLDNNDFTSGKLARVDPQIDFNWGTGAPDSSIGADTFSVRWSGYVEAPQEGTYSFQTSTDDGVRLWVGDLNTPLIDDWRTHGETARTATKHLTAGKHRIVMEYFEETGGAVARLRWKPPTASSFAVIPASRLSPPGDWKLKLDRGGPQIGTPSGALWDRRNHTADHRSEGLYEASYTATMTATDGSTTSASTQRSGVKAINVSVKNSSGGVVLDSPDPEPQGCAAGSCDKRRTFTLNTDDVPDGDYTIEVTAVDQLDNPTSPPLSWQVTVDRRGDIFESSVLTGDPAQGGASLGREWGRLGTRQARHDDAGMLSTRTTVPCNDDEPQGSQCGETRHITKREEGDSDSDFVMYRSNDPEDARLDVVSETLGISRSEYGDPAATGALTDVTEPFQVLPPARGTQFERFDFQITEESVPSDGSSSDEINEGEDYDESERESSTRTVQARLYLDRSTRLPVRMTNTYDDGTVRDFFWTYDRQRLELSQVPQDFFRLSRPAQPEGENSVDMRGDERVGETQDRETGLRYQPLYLGPNPTLASGEFCLATAVKFQQQDPASPPAPEADSAASTHDLRTITAVEAVYNLIDSDDTCDAGTGSLESPDLEIDGYHATSGMAAELEARYREIAEAISIDPLDGDFSRGGLQPATRGLQPVMAYVLPMDDDETAALVEIGDVTMVITGRFEKQHLNDIINRLENL